MTVEVSVQLIAAILLVPLAGVFAAADAAISSVSRARVENLVRENRSGATALAAIVDDRPRHLNLILLLRLACEAAATVLAAVVAMELIGSNALALTVGVVVVVVVSYVLIGVGPRTLGRQHPYGIALAVAGPVRVLVRVLGPLTTLLIVVGNAITPGKGFREGPFSSEVELREAVDMAARQGGLVDDDERAMIQSVFDLGDTAVREVMVPRTEMVWIERDKTVRQALALALRSGYSRVPVIGETVDDVVGVTYLKDLVRHSSTGSAEASRSVVDRVMRPATFVPDSKRADALLRDMQRDRRHMAVVLDEYGGTAGLVTIEDLLEEIVGEITDEYDAAEHRPIDHLDDGTLRVSSRLPVEDLEEAAGVEFDAEDVETVGGLLAQRLGRVPLPGSEAEVAGLRMRAEGGKDQRGRMRVTAVLVWTEPDPDPGTDPGIQAGDDGDTASVGGSATAGSTGEAGDAGSTGEAGYAGDAGSTEGADSAAGRPGATTAPGGAERR